MRDGLPSAVTDDEVKLLGPRLFDQQSYLRSLLASAWRQEAMLERLVTASASTPTPKKGKGA